MSSAQSLQNRVVIITGAASGIGAATAQRLAQAHAKLALADIDAAGLHEKCHALSRCTRAIAVPTDVSQPSAWQNLLRRTLQEFGHVDVLINCAGVIHPGPLEELPQEELHRQIDVNFLGTVYGTQAFLPHFRQRNSGHFVHLASLGGIAPLPGESVYSATKFAVRGFCLALALELQHTGIKVSVVCPDSVETSQLRQEALQGGSPLSFTGSLLQPCEIACAIVKTILHPRREVLIPAWRGWLTKVVNFSPRLMAWLYPALDKIGRNERERYRLRLQSPAIVKHTA